MEFSKKVKAFLIYTAIALPLVYTPFTYFPANYGKSLLFIAAIEVICIFVLLQWGFKKQSPGSLKNWITSLTIVDKSVIAFLVVLGLASIFGENPSQSFWSTQARISGWFMWAHYVVWYFFVRAFFADTNKACKGIVVALGIASIIALTAFFPRVMPEGWHAAYSSRLAGIFGNAAFLANYLNFMIGLGVVAALSTTKRIGRVVLFSLVAIFIVLLVLTSTRGAFLGLVSGVGLTIGILAIRAENKKTRTISRWGVVGGAVLVLGLLILSLYSTPFQKSFPRLSNLFNVRSYSIGTAMTRFFAWGEALKGIRERPVLGWGMENFDVVHNRYYNPKLLRYSFTETVWDKPHNWLLEIGVAAGVIGVISYLFLNGASLLVLFKPKKNREDAWGSVPVRATLAGLIVGSFIQNLFLFDTVNTAIFWFFVLGITSSYYGYAPNLAASTGGTRKDVRSVAAVLVSLGIIFIAYRGIYLPFTMSYHLSKAYKASNALDWARQAQKTLAINAPIKTESAVFLAERFIQMDKGGAAITHSTVVTAAEQVAKTLSDATTRNSSNPIGAIWAGQVYTVLGEKVSSTYFAQAERELKQAVDISPRKQDFLFLLARTYLLQHKTTEALAVQRQALEADPEVLTSYWFLGLTQIAAGQTAAGLDTIEKARQQGFSLTKDQMLYIIDNYASIKRYDKIIELYKELLKEDPENIGYHQSLAATYAAAGMKKEALETVRFLIRFFPPIKEAAEKFIKDNELDK